MSIVMAGPSRPSTARDPCTDDTDVLPGRGVLDDAGAVGQQARVVAPHCAHEYAGAATAQCAGTDTGVLQRLPRQFERQALLRIGLRRLTRRHAEEAGIEAVDVVDESAVAVAMRPGA